MFARVTKYVALLDLFFFDNDVCLNMETHPAVVSIIYTQLRVPR